jgi:hypothetical protein
MGSVSQHEPDFVPSSGPRNGLQFGPASPQITATPLANRTEVTPARPSAIPGRLLKPPLSSDFVPTSSPLRPVAPQSPAILEEHVPSLSMSIDTVPTSSPIQGRKSRYHTGKVVEAVSLGMAPLFKTPIKPRNGRGSEFRHQQSPNGRLSTGKQLTIYQQLGWDDDDMDEL